MKMTSGESSLRMPKEATCDVECAMKVEEIRILSKKRKQTERGGGGDGAVSSSKGTAHAGKGTKRPLPNGSGSSKTTTPPPDHPASSSGLAGGVKTAAAPMDGGGGSGGGANVKDASRRRFVWSVPLHQDFVAAVFDVGLKCASPKLLLEMMPVVDGLTSEHIKSHLQKYRLHRQRSREEFLKSYNYLTDLDGNKGLGGGSAAATVAKAAAAAAGGGGGGGDGGSGGGGDSKIMFPSCGPEPEQLTRCGSSCECEDTPNRSGGGVSGGSVKSLPMPMAAPPTTTSKDGGAERGGGDFKVRLRQDAAATAAGIDAGVETQRLLQQHAGGGTREAVSSTLLLSHLELLAKGIDMQVKFHNHLRDVVESQQLLHTQVAERQASSSGQLHQQQQQQQQQQQPTKGTGGSPRIATSITAGVVLPSAVGVSPPTSHQHVATGGGGGGGGVCAHQHKQAPREANSLFGVGGGGDLPLPRCERTLSGPRQTAPGAGGLGWSGADAGTHKPGGPPKAAGRGTGGAETPGRRGRRPSGLSHAGTIQSGEAGAGVGAVSSNVSVSSACAAAGGGRRRDAATGQHTNLPGDQAGKLGDGKQPQQQQQQQQQYFDPAAMREAFSVQAGPGLGRVSLQQGLLSMGGRQAPSGIVGGGKGEGGGGGGARGYVPGDFTLTSKSTDSGACGAAANAQGQAAFMLPGEGRVGAHASVFGARSPAEARAALAAAGLAPATPTATSGQENLTLQRHMQAQMSMQQSMLSACNDQTTSFGGQRTWCGGGGVAAPAASPALHRCGSAGGAGAEEEGSGVSGGCGGGGGGGGGGGDEASAELGNNKEQRLDALSLHPNPDPGDPSSVMMDVLHQDDMFDFGVLDRGSDLKPGDNNPSGPTPARSAGDEHSTLFSFLME